MDAPRQKHTLISDMHAPARTSRPVHRNVSPEPRLQAMPPRPLKYASDIIAPQKQGTDSTYARFYRKAVDVAERSLKEPGTGVSLAHQAVIQAHPAPLSTKRDYQAPLKKKTSKRALKGVRRTANILVAVAILMSGVMGFMVYRYHLALQKVEAMPLQAATGIEHDDAVSTDSAPSQIAEAKPAAASGSSRKLAPGTPYTISIPKLKVSSASVIGVGLTKKGAMNVPGNIWQVGWDKSSSTPASNSGLVIMNGHVHGPTQPGIFANLTKLKPGDIITVKDVGGTTYTYKMVSSQTFKAGEAEGSLQQSASPTKQGLNLVTCTGEIKNDEYLSRLVVFAERV